ncbi:hypothetical protein V8E51_002787, partial [Hyaloscypha variabilis]
LLRLSKPLSRIIACIYYRGRSTYPKDNPIELLLFRFALIIIILFFIFIGFTALYKLTKGVLRTLIIKSKIIKDYFNLENPENLLNT